MRMPPDSIRALVKAKRFPHYPKNPRPSSDDKRLIFFAKVLAGLEHGLAPLSATKRLSHWDFSKESLEKILTERDVSKEEKSK